MPLNLKISADGEPQKTFTKWHATPSEGGEEFLVAYTVPFKDGDGNHRGLAQTRYLSKIPNLYYDRVAAAKDFGLWAHFMWPTIVAESAGGHHLLVNTYDRARFTFGFYQLAAHTPDDNLILLFRELLKLQNAATYFPDLTLQSNRVHRIAGGQSHSLETVTSVHRPNGKLEKQILGFMAYLNPDTTNVTEISVVNSAKLMHWLVNDPEAVKVSVGTAMGIMRRKIKRLATIHGLRGKEPELAIWVSDITHQGRGTKKQIDAALKKSTLAGKLDALYRIGSNNPDYNSRRKTVRNHIKVLMDEEVFADVALGNAKLPL